MAERAREPAGAGLEDLVDRFLERVDGGDEVDVDTWCDGQPEPLREGLRKECARLVEVKRLLAEGRREREDGALAGRRLGDFQLVELLGRGGMGEVYRAFRPSSGEPAAVKVLHPHLAGSPAFRERFKREVVAAQEIDHPCIPRALDFGEEDGIRYFAMQHVDGKSLHELLRRGGLVARARTRNGRGGAAAEAARIVRDVAAALERVHAAGIIHRDVKPQNILLDREGRPHLIDFGLAKDARLETITVPGDMAGTPQYMSPEQAMAQRVRVDHRTDVYSLGVVLYEALTLRRPFEGANSRKVLYEIQFSPPRPPREIDPRIPRDLETICLKAMEKNPDHRFRSAGELSGELDRFCRHEAILTERPAPLVRLARRIARRPWPWAAGLAAVAALVVGALVGARHVREQGLAREVASLEDVLAAPDLGSLDLGLLAARRALAADLVRRASGATADDARRALERIEDHGRALKGAGRALLDRALISGPRTSPDEHRPEQETDFFRGLRLLERAHALLPADADLRDWTRSTFGLPRIRFVSGPEGAQVYLQSLDWYSGRAGEPRALGALTMGVEIPVEPGYYRVVVVEAGAGHCELVRELRRRGRTFDLAPVVRPPAEATRDMVRVPAGAYVVGDPKATDHAHLAEREARLDAFWIDREEVTNGEYLAFVRATGHPLPRSWGGRPRPELASRPVVGVSWFDAVAYAEWAGKRLPTWIEWEAAARGPEGHRFPWGDDADDLQARAVVHRGPGTRRHPWSGHDRHTLPVGTSPDVSRDHGLHDVLGNVREWTESVFTFTIRGEARPDFTSRVVKGHNWFERTRARFGLVGLGRAPVIADDVGFRCARSCWPR